MIFLVNYVLRLWVCTAATVSAVSSSSLQVQERRVLARSAFLLASLPPDMMQAHWAPASAAARARRLRTRMVGQRFRV